MKISIPNRKWYTASHKASFKKLADHVMSHYPKDTTLHKAVKSCFKSTNDAASKLAMKSGRPMPKRRKARRAPGRRRTRRTGTKARRRTVARRTPRRSTRRVGRRTAMRGRRRMVRRRRAA